jgi:hypothetical protein
MLTLKDILCHTVRNNAAAFQDPTRLIRMGYKIDSHLANMRTFNSRKSDGYCGFIQLHPEGPRNK